jgi:hypothetical protein
MKTITAIAALLLAACASGGGGTGTYAGNHNNQPGAQAAAFTGTWRFQSGSGQVSCTDGTHQTASIVGATATVTEVSPTLVEMVANGSDCVVLFTVEGTSAVAEPNQSCSVNGMTAQVVSASLHVSGGLLNYSLQTSASTEARSCTGLTSGVAAHS